jgi:hypothetical protein
MDSLLKNDLEVTYDQGFIRASKQGVQIDSHLPKHLKVVGLPIEGLALVLKDQELQIRAVSDLFDGAYEDQKGLLVDKNVSIAEWEPPYLYYVSGSTAVQAVWDNSNCSLTRSKKFSADPGRSIPEECMSKKELVTGKIVGDVDAIGIEVLGQADIDAINNKILISTINGPPCTIGFSSWKDIPWTSFKEEPCTTLERPQVPSPTSIKHKELPHDICSLLKVLSS